MTDLFNHFEGAIERPLPKRYRPPLEVPFAPRAWTTAQMMDVTGPYAYALNLPQIAECLVGNLLLRPFAEQMIDRNGKRAPETPDQLALKLHEDGLHFLGNQMPAKGYVLAFFLKPETSTRPSELICARRDSNSLWSCRIPSRKGGCNKPYQPSQKDMSGNPMTDIRRADFGTETEFLGYGSVPYAGIAYYRRTVLPDQDMRPFYSIVPAEVRLEKR